MRTVQGLVPSVPRLSECLKVRGHTQLYLRFNKECFKVNDLVMNCNIFEVIFIRHFATCMEYVVYIIVSEFVCVIRDEYICKDYNGIYVSFVWQLCISRRTP